MKRIGIGTLMVLFLAFPLLCIQHPDEFLQVRVGADKVLVSYPDIGRYLNYLAQNSPRIRVSDEGKTTLGNPMYLAVISSEQNIRNLARLQEVNRKLAAPDLLGDGEAAALLAEARPFVLITASLHATEIGASQMSLLLAHRLVNADDEETRRILDRVVLLLMPSINPDGQIMTVDWYRKYLGTPYEGGRQPFLYHHYAGHDNNRDFFMLNLKESQVVNAVVHQRYFPQIFLDMHQMGNEGPRIFVPPFADPLNPNLSPVMIRQAEAIGSYMALRLQEEGKKGVANGYAFDAYWPGGSKNTSWFKNVVGLLTELAGANIATPIYVDPTDLRGGGKGLPEYKAQVNFPDPWPGGWWRLSDVLQYEMTAAVALLEFAADHPREVMRNFLELGREALARGRADRPGAYIVPRGQWDEPELYTFLHKLQQGGVRVYRLNKTIQADGQVFAQGSFVLPLAQPYRNFLKTMMERQRYPEIRFLENGPIMEPYDAAGWTMPLLMGVSCREASVAPAAADMELVPEITRPAPTVEGQGEFYRLSGRANRTFQAVNRLLKKNVPVHRVIQAGVAQPGDFLVPVKALEREALLAALQDTGLAVTLCPAPDAAHYKPVKQPRLAIFQPYVPSMDEGWARWVLDHYEFPYTVLHNADFKDKLNLKKFDVLLIPGIGRGVVVDGRRSPEMRVTNLPPEYQGGIGEKGMDNLKQFVREGGRLVLLESAWEIAQKDFDLPIRDVLKDSREFNCPGSLLHVQVDNQDPLAWGMPAETALYFSEAGAFRTSAPALASVERRIVARFAAEPPHLLSGFLSGEHLLDNAVCAVSFRTGQGRVAVFGGRILNRAQTFATFKFLFNAVFMD